MCTSLVEKIRRAERVLHRSASYLLFCLLASFLKNHGMKFHDFYWKKTFDEIFGATLDGQDLTYKGYFSLLNVKKKLTVIISRWWGFALSECFLVTCSVITLVRLYKLLKTVTVQFLCNIAWVKKCYTLYKRKVRYFQQYGLLWAALHSIYCSILTCKLLPYLNRVYPVFGRKKWLKLDAFGNYTCI